VQGQEPNKLRVGLFTESYDPVVNGVTTSVKTLARELTRAGHRPVVVAPRFPGYIDPPPSPEVSETLRLASWRTPMNRSNPFAYPPIFPVPRIMRTDPPFDVVHTQQPFGMGQHGRRIARAGRVPLVSTFHTLYLEYAHYAPIFPPPVAAWWLTRTMRRYYNACDAVVTPSRAAGRALEAMGVRPGLIRVVATGVAAALPVSPAEVDAARARYDLPLGAPVVLFVGRLAREKNLDVLVDAFAQVAREWNGRNGGGATAAPLLVFAGNGPYVDGCKVHVRAGGVEAQTRFTGFLTRAELGPLYALASVFAFPSATDTQGIALSEAQSHGLPCVVANAGGAPEFVRADVDALVVEPTAPAFAQGLAALLTNDDKRQSFARAALESPLRPTPDGMARRMVEVYEEAISAPLG